MISNILDAKQQKLTYYIEFEDSLCDLCNNNAEIFNFKRKIDIQSVSI